MKKIFLFLLFIVFTVLLSSCNTNYEADIVTTLFPHYDISKQIVGDKLKVSIVTPFGSEAHDFEPSPKQIEAINKAKLFIYTSNEFDFWVGKLTNNKNTLNTFDYINIESDDLSTIIHYWTDPLIFIEMIEVIADEIIKIDLINKDFYVDNKNNYINEILDIHNNLYEFLNTKDYKEIFFAGHNALGGFSIRYDLRINSLVDDFKPDADHTIKDIENLVESLKSSNTKYLFIEELVEPKVANTIKRELAKKGITITLLELHGYHNITKKQAKENLSYGQIFYQNYRNLKQALD